MALYAAIVFLFWMSLYLYMPTLPTYVQTKTANLAMVGAVLSMYGLWQALARLPLGIAVDWAGWRKPFIIGGLALAGLGAWLMGSAQGVNGVLVGRAITGLAAATWVPLVVVFSALFPPEDAVRASALLTLVNSVGRAAATALSGPMSAMGGYGLGFTTAAGVATLAVILALLTTDRRNPPRRPSLGGIGCLITRRDVLMPALLSAVGHYVTYATVFAFLPILAKRLGADSMLLSAMMTSNLILFTLGNLGATALIMRTGERALVYLCFGLLSAGTAGVALAPTLAVLFTAQLLIGLGMGIGYPVLMGMSIRYVADPERATAMGLHQSVYAIGMFVGPWLSGILAEAIGIRPMFGITAVVSLILGVLGTAAYGRAGRKEPASQ
jgi:DHA1 family multidrug resistance protein-like MFS transporter